MDADGAVCRSGEVDRVTFEVYESGPVGVVSTHPFVVCAAAVGRLVEALGGLGGSGLERFGYCRLNGVHCLFVPEFSKFATL